MISAFDVPESEQAPRAGAPEPSQEPRTPSDPYPSDPLTSLSLQIRAQGSVTAASLRARRLALGVGLGVLADQLGVNRSNFSEIELGYRRPLPGLIDRWTAALDAAGGAR